MQQVLFLLEGIKQLPQFDHFFGSAPPNETGFTGYHEVEIFSTTHWSEDQHDYLKRIIDSVDSI